jgi:hypothetical protein
MVQAQKGKVEVPAREKEDVIPVVGEKVKVDVMVAAAAEKVAVKTRDVVIINKGGTLCLDLMVQAHKVLDQ